MALVDIVLWVAPLLVVAYVVWLLTRLTQAVERIEWRLTQMDASVTTREPMP